MSNTRLGFEGFLQRCFRKYLGQGQLLGNKLVPPQVFLHPPFQTRQKPCTAVLQVSIQRRMKKRLISFRSQYQILDDLNHRLAIRGKWCRDPCFGTGVYEAYLLGGLRLPFNAFARELLTRLGLEVCQFNPNAWRLVVFMQILWREVFEGDRPLIVDEFLYCYKPSEISQSLGFHQFTVRGKDCRLIKSLPAYDRNWKTEFFFVSSFWAGNPVKVGRDPFAPYTRELGNLCPEGMFLSY